MVSDLLFVGPFGLDISQNKYKGRYTRQLTFSDKSSILINVTNEEPFLCYSSLVGLVNIDR